MPEAQPQVPPGADDLQRRRREIGRGLSRSHYAVVVVSGLFGLIALAALWLGGEARHGAEDARAAQRLAETNAAAARDASLRLWEFSARAARQQRLTRSIGQRSECLEIIREAARFLPSRELRDEALSALLLPDVGTNLVWHKETGFEIAAAYDTGFEHFIQNNDRGRAIVRRATDGATLMDEKGLGRGTPFWQFSPDGRLAAISFYGGQIGVWDWRTTNLVATFQGISVEFGHPSFDFSPDGRHLWLLASPASLREYAIETGRPTRSISPSQPVRSIRLSPSGRFAALAGRQELEVWELSSRKQHAALTLTNRIWRLAWQPGEERLAIGCFGGLYLWSVGAAEALLLEAADIAVTHVFFNPDGNLLFAGGWNHLGEIWDVRRQQRVVEGNLGCLRQISRDQRRLATDHEKAGYGVREFLPPVGRRDWPAPASLGNSRQSADMDRQERWLVTAHAAAWLIRDAESGCELARAQCEDTLAASFSADGSNVLVWTQAGLQRWPLRAAEDPVQLTVGSPELVWASAGQPLTVASFAAGRRHAACCQDGRVTVLDLENTGRPVQFRLRLPSDNSHYISPDGHWLVTGHNNQHGLDLYDTRAGRFIRTFAQEGFAGPAFDPNTGRLFTCTAAEHCLWNPESGELIRKIPWRTPAPQLGFFGFAPDGRLALVKSSSSAFQLYDLPADRAFATFDFRDPQAVFACHWSRQGQRLFLFGSDGGVTRLDLTALRAELATLGLDWSDAAPSRDFAAPPAPMASETSGAPSSALGKGSPAAWRSLPRLVWLASAGLLLTLAMGHYILRYQRRLFGSYLQTEILAEERAGELRDTHAALAHSEKMKALGTMAAGVAHDFNNLLSVIRLSSELIEEQTRPEGATKENFDAIQHAVQRGRGIVNSMLGYARDDGQVRPFAPGALISEVVALLSKPFLSGLVLQIQVDPTMPDLIGRKGRAEQMLLNLIVNAAEAMGGRGTLRLAAREVNDASGCVLPPRAAASYDEITVADTGPGIPSDVLPRIFEPFFTTKNQGAQRGTGLGLSMLYSMAQEDGVGVGVESEPGRGATFRLLLPVESAAQASKSTTLPGTEPASAGASATPPGDGATAAGATVGATRPLAEGVQDGQT